jgi:hypothetical protein
MGVFKIANRMEQRLPLLVDLAVNQKVEVASPA